MLMGFCMPDSIIQFSHVSFGWNKLHLLFSNLDFSFPSDKIIVLTGENGSGKSTFASLIAGLIIPTIGTISHNGLPTDAKHSGKLYKSIACLQQKTEKNIVGIDAESDLYIWSLSQSTHDRNEEQIKQELDNWGLTDIRNRPVWELSAGELKRLCLAGISLYPDRYWVLDEPEAALDSVYCAKLVAFLQNKAQHQTGALIISHKPALYKDICSELWHINSDGTIKQTVRGAF